LWVCPGPLPPERARAALERGVAGVLSTELVALLGAGTGTGTGTGWSELTVRESQILRSIAAGDTVRQTARWLGITEKTVQNTQARLFRKFGCRNRAATLARAIDLGLLDPSRSACP
jgi:DNA-binding CsgD family transcriptional regulator